MSTPRVAYVPCASTARQTLSDRRKRSLNVPSTNPCRPGNRLPRDAPRKRHSVPSNRRPFPTDDLLAQPSCQDPSRVGLRPPKTGTATGSRHAPWQMVLRRCLFPRTPLLNDRLIRGPAAARLPAPTAFHRSSVAIGVPRATPTAEIPRSPDATSSKSTR